MCVCVCVCVCGSVFDRFAGTLVGTKDKGSRQGNRQSARGGGVIKHTHTHTHTHTQTHTNSTKQKHTVHDFLVSTCLSIIPIHKCTHTHKHTYTHTHTHTLSLSLAGPISNSGSVCCCHREAHWAVERSRKREGGIEGEGGERE